ncbi:MAG: hypothetical protein COT90_00060 [Candidatus Diapherotrites archaeon CG10_big_fil_rev_8_21_14_0_10_31_34]|nr:MAG: hypothetical protein COT90_00060 [Candidatus Diapherotrites archaeon CG10_big_fil_rev_8_21_14_0_10_31_34]PJA16765.1 MAG: hypothetical protein COX63_03135 [Candidatus Diapherotrites archaeon CG_4_10_14_0_2_um_filter_31_5]
MKIIITGTPGTGKTVIAGKLGKKLEYKVINEKDFALKTKSGKQTFSKSLIKKSSQANKEIEIDTKKFEKKINEFLKEKDNLVLEGHVLCEMKINVDKIFVLRTKREILEKRLKKKKYNEVKIQDNLFCEEIDYCSKKALKNYKKVTEIMNEKTLNSSIQKIIKKIKEKK